MENLEKTLNSLDFYDTCKVMPTEIHTKMKVMLGDGYKKIATATKIKHKNYNLCYNFNNFKVKGNKELITKLKELLRQFDNISVIYTDTVLLFMEIPIALANSQVS